MLISGATGSGKSVCLTSIITSLVLLYSPYNLRLLLIDPKRVELAAFSNIPHLLCEVITNPKKANFALKELVSEMDSRFKIFKEKRCKNIFEYNEENHDLHFHMPYIVAVIDELANLMMAGGKEVEDQIRILTQTARAAGIHLIVATQRPSTDIITGVIKANIPTRISFAVSSSIDSRTILDRTGAEKLLGKGDMLYLSPEDNLLKRLQGILVTKKETDQICKFASKQSKQCFVSNFHDIINQSESALNQSQEKKDVLYDEAKAFILETRKASASLLQRRFSIGYNRAARLIDYFEEEGIIGPATNSSKSREVLI